VARGSTLPRTQPTGGNREARHGASERGEPPDRFRADDPLAECLAGGATNRLRAAWEDMRELADFDLLLAAFRITERQALRLAGTELAHPISMVSANKLLSACASYRLPIAIVVENRGASQRCTGVPETVSRVGTSLVVGGPSFVLDARADLVESAWIVRRPSNGRAGAFLELYSAQGERGIRIGATRDERARIAWAILTAPFGGGSE
jgi:putative heme degradation protein